jgi:methionyl-tRNA formyltransferase
MNERFDAVDVLRQQPLAIQPRESTFSLCERLAKAASEILPEAVDLALQGESGRGQDMSQFSYFSHPDRAAYFSLRRHGHALVRPLEPWRSLREQWKAARRP